METLPAVRALNLSVPEIEASSRFYSELFPRATVSEGVFANIKYRALVGEDGEVAVCLFEKTPDNPLAESFPTIMVNSVDEYLPRVTAAQGKVIVAPNPCPCTGAPFAICEDSSGEQFMIKEPRS